MPTAPAKRARRRAASTDVAVPQSAEVTTVEELVKRGREALLQIVAAEDGFKDQYALLADTLISLRQHFRSPGKDFPDWRGRSQEYRTFAAQVYADAEIPPDSESAIQARIRYVINTRIREVAPAEQLDALGYQRRNPAEREADRRAAKKSRRVLDSDGPALTATQPIVTRAEAFRAVRRVVEEVVWELPIPEEEDEAGYVELMSELVQTAKLFEQLWALTERRRSDRRHAIEVASTYAATRQHHPGTPAELAQIRENAAQEARFLSGARAVEPVSELESGE